MPVLVNPYLSFGSTPAADAWTEVGRVTSVSGGKLTISGLDLSAVMVVRLYINGVTVTTDDSTIQLRFLVSGSEVSTGYRWGAAKVAPGIAAADVVDNSDPGIGLTSITATQKVGNAAEESFGAVATVYAPGGSLFKRASFRSVWTTTTGAPMTFVNGGGQLDNTGALTGFALVGSSNLVAGSMIAMGLA